MMSLEREKLVRASDKTKYQNGIKSLWMEMQIPESDEYPISSLIPGALFEIVQETYSMAENQIGRIIQDDHTTCK